jgi:hypothetical protein
MILQGAACTLFLGAHLILQRPQEKIFYYFAGAAIAFFVFIAVAGYHFARLNSSAVWQTTKIIFNIK